MTIFVLACRYLPVFPEGPVAETEKKRSQPAIAEVPAGRCGSSKAAWYF